MPKLQYWFCEPVLQIAGVFAFFAVLGLFGIKEMIPTASLYLLIAVALFLIFSGWKVAAKQEEALVKQKDESAELKKILYLIKEGLQLDLGSTKSLTQLSNDEIRKRVNNLTARMRIFEAGSKEAQTQLHFSGMTYSQTDTEEQRHAKWNAKTNKMIQQSTNERNEFHRQFLPEASALREEMVLRLGILKPYTQDHRSIAIDYGMLAGVSPISDACLYLEELARKLPA